MSNKNENRFIFLKTEVRSILNLRHQILRPNNPPKDAEFYGDNEMETFHFALHIAGEREPVCCVSYMLVPYEDGQDAYQLRGMATAEAWQSKGCGKEIVAKAQELIMQNTGITRFWCKAREEAIVFYEKQGWRVASELFNVEGVGPHKTMTFGI